MQTGGLDPETLTRARAGERDALVRVLARFYPQVYRMSLNLSGDIGTGAKVAERVMRQSVRAAEGWEHEDAPGRWFRHHTVLATRAAARGVPERDHADPLIVRGPEDPQHVAMVRALRKLPAQQREAFLLHHGEGFDTRQLGIAMDCSVEAAKTHFEGATRALTALHPQGYAQRVESLVAAYLASEPDERLAIPHAKRLVRSGTWKVVAALVGIILLLGLMGAIAYGLWWLWPRLVL